MDPRGTRDDTWDSGEAWSGARERARDEVRAALAPRPRVCRNCGNEEDATSAAVCSRCGTPYMERLDPGMSRRAKRRLLIAAVATFAVLGAAAALIVPSVQHGKNQAGARERADAQAALARERRRLALDQRLHTATAPGRTAELRALPATQLTARLRSDLEGSITADARARVRAHTLQGPILRTQCSAVRGAAGPPVGKYSCVAVNTEILRNTPTAAGALGYPFWAIVDFRRLRYSWCKLNPQAGEGSATPGSVSLAVPPPRGCNIER
jgi:type II secretory pathway pseudopilin PulG/ribosomal protein L37E